MASRPLQERLQLFEKLLNWFVENSDIFKMILFILFSADKNYTCLHSVANSVSEKVRIKIKNMKNFY